MRRVEVYLLLGLLWAGRAQAADELGQIWFGAKAAAANSTVRYHSTNVDEATSDEATAQFQMPSAGRLLNLVVECAGAPGTGATFTWQSSIVDVNNNPVSSNLTCSVSGNTQTVCADTTHTDDFDANDLVTFAVTTSGSATARDCVIGVQVAEKSDSTTAHNPLILFGDATAVSPSSATRYGAPSIVAATQRLNQANNGTAGLIVPVDNLTFSYLCVQLNLGVASGRSESFVLQNSTTNEQGSVLTLNRGDQGGCTSFTLTASAGDLLTVEFTHTSSAESRSRMVTIEYTGGGGWIGSGAPWATSTKYFTMQEGTNTTASALPQRVSQSGVIRHLYALADAFPTTPQVLTLYTGASSSVSSTTLSVTLPTAGPTPPSGPTPTMPPQSDTTHEILVHQGDYLDTEIKTAGASTHTTMWGYEFVPNGARYAVNVGAESTPTPSLWSSNTHWSLDPTGTRTPGTTIPTALDDCYVDASSFSGSSQTFTVDTDAACQSLDTTGMGTDDVLEVENGKTLTVSGDLTLADGSMTVDGTANVGSATISGTLTNDGTFTADTASLMGSGAITNNGTLTVGDLTVDSGTTLTNSNSLAVTSSLTLPVPTPGMFANTGAINVGGTLTTSGTSMGALTSSGAATLADDVSASSWVLSTPAGIDTSGDNHQITITGGGALTFGTTLGVLATSTLGSSTLLLQGAGAAFQIYAANTSAFSGGSAELKFDGGTSSNKDTADFSTLSGWLGVGKLTLTGGSWVTTTKALEGMTLSLGDVLLTSNASPTTTLELQAARTFTVNQIESTVADDRMRPSIQSTTSSNATLVMPTPGPLALSYVQLMHITGPASSTCACCADNGGNALTGGGTWGWTPCPTGTPTPVPPTNTFTATPVNTFTFTPTPVNTFTFTATPVNTFTFTATPVNTFTFTATPVNTFTFTATPVNTFTFTATPVNTFTFTATPVDTLTFTATPVDTFTFTATPADTFTFTPTPADTPTCLGPLYTFTPPATPTPNSCNTPAVPVNVTARFYLDPSNPYNPFPSDRLLDTTDPTKPHVVLPPAYISAVIPTDVFPFDVEALAQEFNLLDGFGTFTPLRIRFSSSMADFHDTGHGIMLFTYDETSGTLGADQPRFTASAYEPDVSIEVQPVIPLTPKTTYALVVTNDLRDAGCNPVTASADFTQLTQPTPAPTPLDCKQTDWRGKVLGVLDALEARDPPVSRTTVALVEVFTTESTTDDLVAIEALLDNGTLVLPTPAMDLEPGSTDDDQVTIFHGYFPSYDFRTSPSGGFDPSKVSGTLTPASGSPTPVPLLGFNISIPKTSTPVATGAPTPTPFPISLVGDYSEDAVRTPLPTFEPRNVSRISISAVGQAERGDPDHVLGGIFSFLNVNATASGQRGTCLGTTNACAIETDCPESGVEVCPDGGSCFRCARIVGNVSQMRENFRQTVADYLQLTKMIQSAHDNHTPPFDLIDPSHMSYEGISLGGFLGVLYMAVEPDAQVALLAVPGGGLTHAAGLDDEAASLVSPAFGIPVDDPSIKLLVHGAKQLGQWGIEKADPINYAPYMIVHNAQLCIPAADPSCTPVPPKRILLHDGIVDDVVPNRMKDDLALAMSLPDVKASGGCTNPDVCGGCSGIWRFVISDYLTDPSEGHGVEGLHEAIDQWVAYLGSDGTNIGDASPDLYCVSGVCEDFLPPTVTVINPAVANCACVGPATPTPATVTPTSTSTPGPADAWTPTPTPGPNDCCQGDGACAAPPDGALCGNGTAVYNTVCGFVVGTPVMCVTPTPTPTAGLNDCCQDGPSACVTPVESAGCGSGVVVYNAVCGDSGCATWTPTPTPGPGDCCQGDEEMCAPPLEVGRCSSGTAVYNAVCGDGGCVTPTPGPNDCCQYDGPSCQSADADLLCASETPGVPVYNAACGVDGSCASRTPTPTPTPTALTCPATPTP